MKSKIKSFLTALLVLLFWLAVWDIGARLVDLEFVLPSVKATLVALVEILGESGVYVSVISSVLRIFLSFLVGTLAAILLAILSIKFSFFKTLISPVMTVAKATPVAVFIMILWLMLGGAKVPGAIAVLMVLPIVWQNVIDGYEAIDKRLEEVCQVYRFGFFKKMKLLVLPTVFKFLFPGIITASGLAWKAGIAAEIICMTKNSIGKEIYNAKYLLDGPKMFAYTILVLLLSYAIERLIKFTVERIGKKWHL